MSLSFFFLPDDLLHGIKSRSGHGSGGEKSWLGACAYQITNSAGLRKILVGWPSFWLGKDLALVR